MADSVSKGHHNLKRERRTAAIKIEREGYEVAMPGSFGSLIVVVLSNLSAQEKISREITKTEEGFPLGYSTLRGRGGARYSLSDVRRAVSCRSGIGVRCLWRRRLGGH
ncbi:hypothetical protein VTG60DRAFT_6076 [Thermothelomyces hinnuleus]